MSIYVSFHVRRKAVSNIDSTLRVIAPANRTLQKCGQVRLRILKANGTETKQQPGKQKGTRQQQNNMKDIFFWAGSSFSAICLVAAKALLLKQISKLKNIWFRPGFNITTVNGRSNACQILTERFRNASL